MSNISINLGRPIVTCISATPAKWNTFNAICVEGSPNDWAVTNPSASPGQTFPPVCNSETSLLSSPYLNSMILSPLSLTVPSYSSLKSWKAFASLLYK